MWTSEINADSWVLVTVVDFVNWEEINSYLKFPKKVTTRLDLTLQSILKHKGLSTSLPQIIEHMAANEQKLFEIPQPSVSINAMFYKEQMTGFTLTFKYDRSDKKNTGKSKKKSMNIFKTLALAMTPISGAKGEESDLESDGTQSGIAKQKMSAPKLGRGKVAQPFSKSPMMRLRTTVADNPNKKLAEFYIPTNETLVNGPTKSPSIGSEDGDSWDGMEVKAPEMKSDSPPAEGVKMPMNLEDQPEVETPNLQMATPMFKANNLISHQRLERRASVKSPMPKPMHENPFQFEIAPKRKPAPKLNLLEEKKHTRSVTEDPRRLLNLIQSVVREYVQDAGDENTPFRSLQLAPANVNRANSFGFISGELI